MHIHVARYLLTLIKPGPIKRCCLWSSDRYDFSKKIHLMNENLMISTLFYNLKFCASEIVNREKIYSAAADMSSLVVNIKKKIYVWVNII